MEVVLGQVIINRYISWWTLVTFLSFRPRYKSTNVPSERGNLLRALGETRDVFTIQKYLDMTLNQVFGKKVLE